ncbi:DNA methyltransferase [Vibrio aestuarianus]|uniref:Site-specific DNA-methyltransferase n=1 Tax=Vibrio aestuarianus TaxID=28171 RepID=A0A9X4FAB8_9VIBR|nr:DNA methyltransferase [Vibrio aestuarianus]MDE1347059.1 site-specific DNA-methyltransferase [Vibrio aestuarianus]
MNQENLFDIEGENKPSGPVECLGMTFESDEDRRAHFTALLREKLQNPEFRAIEGFPIGTDEAILELSDPPYYTACPNPWISSFVEYFSISDNDYEPVAPFAADIKEGRNDPVYNSHSYHTKVPYKAIMKYILHYTKPGDIVLDSFCGSGMTGIAANLCGDRDTVLSLGYDINEQGDIFTEETKSKLGARKSIVNDLSPAGTYISSNFNQEIDLEHFNDEIDVIFKRAKDSLGWMYKTKHDDGQIGEVNFILWSDVFTCKNCSSEVIYWDAAVDEDDGKIKDIIPCSSCGLGSKKKELERIYITVNDSGLSKPHRIAKQIPILINYTINGKKYTKKPDSYDFSLLEKIEDYQINSWYPTDALPVGYNTAQPIKSHGLSHVHHFFTKRNLAVLSFCFDLAISDRTKFVLTALMFKSSQLCAPLMSNYFAALKGKSRGGWVGKERSGTLYCPSIHTEVSIFPQIKSRSKAMNFNVGSQNNTIITTGSATNLDIADSSVDYVFIDPPFGSNINYSEMSFIWESWLKVKTNNLKEAIESKVQNKTVDDYRKLMTESFSEVYRVLKPGKWMTVEFSNTSAIVWNNIQTAILEAGFVVADVSALNKNQNSIMAYITNTAVKQDLIISAYKPTDEFTTKFSSKGDENAMSDFIRNHLKFIPVFKIQGNELLNNPERDPRIIFDRMVSYFIRNNKSVPVGSHDFQVWLDTEFHSRDGMVFLPEQVIEYDKKRAVYLPSSQISMFVEDEASAIEWMRQELKSKPKTYSEIHPLFLNELSGWKKNELELELSTLLEQNFLKYDGKDEIPSQIHTYLSTNFKDLRGLSKDDPKLVGKAKDRWYVPDPNKAADLEKVRLRALLKEFETYKAEKKKIKQPRAEALRAGFNTAWEAQDFQTILDISAKIPPAVLQEDEKLLMFYDNALTLTSTEDDEW